jgi:hypothetical protein
MIVQAELQGGRTNHAGLSRARLAKLKIYYLTIYNPMEFFT